MKHPIRFLAVLASLSASLGAQTPLGSLQPPATWVDYGVDLLAAGDLDGDGAADLIAAAWIPVPAPGVGVGLRAISGASQQVLWELSELPTAAMPSYRQPRLDGGPDVDADGVPDILFAADAPQGHGRVDVLSGADGSVIHHVSPDQLGLNDVVAARFVGDVNQDGVADYVAGFSRGFATGSTNRMVWFSGATGAQLFFVSVDPSALSDYNGMLAAVGDLDGDGCSELCTSFNGISFYTGRAWLHDGRTGALLRTYDGTEQGALFGSAACGVGDVDGDGRNDFAISAPGGIPGTTAGSSVRVYSGATLLPLWQRAEPQPSHLGWALSSAGDLDADGVPDLLINGDDSPNYPATNAGFALLVSGIDGATIARIDGTPADYFGYSLECLDLDGDGRREFVIAAPDYDTLQPPTGRLDVFRACQLPPQRTCGANAAPGGCDPTLDASGSTQWGAPVNVAVTAAGLAPGRACLLLIGRYPAVLPFSGGATLCIGGPIRRLLAGATTGSPAGAPCTGTFAGTVDEALLASRGFGPGDGFTMQLWVADPSAARGALSDALRLVLCP